MESAEQFAILNNDAISKLDKNKLAAYIIELSKHFEAIRNALFADDGLLKKISSQLVVSTKANELLMKKMQNVEKTANGNAQYSRKETFEIYGISEKVSDSKVEEKVLQIMNELKDDDTPAYQSSEIQAYHRLKNRSKVICKMVARKRMRQVINSRKKLKNTELKCGGVGEKVIISESMCPAFAQIDYYARHLKKNSRIFDCWFFNGNYTILMEEKGEKVRISHVADLEAAVGMAEDEIIKLCAKKKPQQ